MTRLFRSNLSEESGNQMSSAPCSLLTPEKCAVAIDAAAHANAADSSQKTGSDSPTLGQLSSNITDSSSMSPLRFLSENVCLDHELGGTAEERSGINSRKNKLASTKKTKRSPCRNANSEAVELPVIALIVGAFKKTSFTACKAGPAADISKMEIGWPTDVRHIAHVTFDRFNGFLGLPVEFQLEVPGRVPSASASVFGVSPDSMQCCYDQNGNSVPTILLLLQERLYDQGGLQAEGIFRINADNGQEEQLREQLNKGMVPNNIDVHCLAGLIKAWFRELPKGVLDSLSPEQVMHCQTEDECVALTALLPPTQVALLNWAVNLMADVVEKESCNKMNARNIAMVFAPNMTQMSDPLTALMHAVHVMNLLKTLIIKTIKDRQESSLLSAGTSPFSNCSYREYLRSRGDIGYSVVRNISEAHQTSKTGDHTRDICIDDAHDNAADHACSSKSFKESETFEDFVSACSEEIVSRYQSSRHLEISDQEHLGNVSYDSSREQFHSNKFRSILDIDSGSLKPDFTKNSFRSSYFNEELYAPAVDISATMVMSEQCTNQI